MFSSSVPALVIAGILALATSLAPAFAQTTIASGKPAATTAQLPHADLFKTAAAAKNTCNNDTIVWSTLSKSKSFHLASSRYYGKTHHGAYLCEKIALAAGYHQAKS